MLLRPATLADLAEVALWVSTAYESELWAGPRVHFPIHLDTLVEAIDFRTHGGFVFSEPDTLLAFGQIVSKSGGRAHLARLIVAPACRGRGLGTRLVKALLDRARTDAHVRASLNVNPANHVAIHVYEKLGFGDAPRPLDEPDPSGSRYMELLF
jgi:ribosomal-protein-alanine N-acetyltransferase